MRAKKPEFSLNDHLDGVFSGTIPRHAIDVVISNPTVFSSHEKEYMKDRLPYSGKALGVCAFFWAKRVGDREEMAEIIAEKAPPKRRAEFAFAVDTYRQKMKEKVSDARSAYHWVKLFQQDADEFRNIVQGDEWVFKWARDIGDEDIMESRISHGLWQMKFEEQVANDDEPAHAA